MVWEQTVKFVAYISMSIICLGFDICKGFYVHMNGWCCPGMMNTKSGSVNSSTSSRFKAEPARIQRERNRKEMKRKSNRNQKRN